jgi:elongator complex protein 5
MQLVLPAVILDASRHQRQHPFVFLESSVAQSSLPVFKAIVNHDDPKSLVLLFCFLYPPSSIVDNPTRLQSVRLQVFDRTSSIPGYSKTGDNITEFMNEAVGMGARAWYETTSYILTGLQLLQAH